MKNNNQGSNTCPKCGTAIKQGIYADWCECGESDQSYL